MKKVISPLECRRLYEEALLLEKYLRSERTSWEPRIVSLAAE
jgi:hypothetical protein